MAKRREPARTARELIEREKAGTLTAADKQAAEQLTAKMLDAITTATALQSAQLRELAATLRAQASELPAYAVLLPAAPPLYALLGRNTDRAAALAPEAHSYQLKLGDGTPTGTESVWLVLGTLSPEARRVLAIICGWWRERDSSAADDRRVVISKRLLAKACYGATDGRAVQRISVLLDELRTTRLQVGIGRTNADGDTELLDEPTTAPLLQILRAGKAKGSRSYKAAKRNSVLVAELNPELHRELLQHHYQRIRTELLKGWESWELQLLLRILTHRTTSPRSGTLHYSSDKKRTELTIGKAAPGELGSLGELLPSLANRAPALERRLVSFAEKLARLTDDDELRVLGIRPRRQTRHPRAPITGWVLELGYEVLPLTSSQIKQLRGLEKAAEGGSRAAALQLAAELESQPELARAYEAYRRRDRGTDERVLAIPGRVSPLQLARVAITRSEAKTAAQAVPKAVAISTIGERDKKTEREPSLTATGRELLGRATAAVGSQTEKLPDRGSRQLSPERAAELRQRWPELTQKERQHLKARYPELAELES